MSGTTKQSHEGEPFKGGLIRYDGDMPRFLYRYRPITSKNLERVRDFEIGQEGIFLAGLADLNDPCEGRFRFVFKGTRREIYKYWISALPGERPDWSKDMIKANAKARTRQIFQDFPYAPVEGMTSVREVLGKLIRVACFTDDPLNPVMWAHYGYSCLDHGANIPAGGICLQYAIGEDWRDCNLHPVIYSDMVPEVDALSMASNEPAAVKSMYMKTPHWSYEAEWRMLAIINARPPFPDNLTANSKIAARDCLRAIIFGLNADSELISELIDAGRQVNSEMEFKKVHQNQESQQLELRRIA